MSTSNDASSALLTATRERSMPLVERNAEARPALNPRSIPVLIVEKDLAARRIVAAAFYQTEFHLIEAETGRQGLALVATARPETVLLELLLPDLDGLYFVQQLREWSQVPIIVVSTQADETLKIQALEHGCDDYVTKPFSVGELLARIRTTWRRSQLLAGGNSEPVIAAGGLLIDLACRRVTYSGQEVHLTPTEYRLLVYLSRHAGKVLTHKQILSDVWGGDYSEESQYLRVYIGYLRKKLEVDPSAPHLIRTEPRVGYRLVG